MMPAPKSAVVVASKCVNCALTCTASVSFWRATVGERLVTTGAPTVTVNAFTPVAISPAVVTTTLREPTDADA